MLPLKILSYPHPLLRGKTSPVNAFDDALRQTLNQMIDLMYREQGCGLAATQVGLPLRLFVMDVSKELNKPQCFINPEIISAQGESLSEEACLSLPGIYSKVPRAKKVHIRYQNEFGTLLTQTLEGLGAYCVQHETEHLDGILFIDHLSKLKRFMLLKKLEKYQRIA